MATEVTCKSCFEEAVVDGVCNACGADQLEKSRDRRALPLWTVVDQRYRIGRVLGSGGFGITYLAEDVVMGRQVALKEFFPNGLAVREGDRLTLTCNSLGDQPPFERGLAKFFMEGRLLAKFRHTNIVQAFDVRSANGTAYLAMEYLDGMTLKMWISEVGRLDAEKALKVIAFVIDALKAIHAKNVIHRDLKPDNVYVTREGRILLLDFGGAKQLAAEAEKSMDTTFAHGYAAPEQYYADSQKIGAWTDVYACGATLYKMLTGQTMRSALERYGDDPPLAWGESDAPPHVRAAVTKAVTLDHKQRHQTIDELQAALFKKAGPIPPPPVDPRMDDDRKDRWFKLGVIGALCVLAIVVGVIAFRGNRPTPSTPTRSDVLATRTTPDVKQKPEDRKVVDTKAVDTRPSDTKAEVKPAEVKPAETKSAIAKPDVNAAIPLTDRQIRDRLNLMVGAASGGDWSAVEAGVSALSASSNGGSGAPLDASVAAGRKAIEAGDYERARSLFDRATKQQPTDPQAWAGLGHALLRLDRPADAKTALFRALRLKPDDPNAWLRLAELIADADPRAVESDGALKLAVYFSTARDALREYVRGMTADVARPEFVAVVKAHAKELESMPERKP